MSHDNEFTQEFILGDEYTADCPTCGEPLTKLVIVKEIWYYDPRGMAIGGMWIASGDATEPYPVTKDFYVEPCGHHFADTIEVPIRRKASEDPPVDGEQESNESKRV